MKAYLLQYPQEEKNVYAMQYAWGEEATNVILNQALQDNKKVKLLIDTKKLEGLEYEFVPV